MHSVLKAIRAVRTSPYGRRFSSRPASRAPWTPGPSPPKLPKEEQELFEKLQQNSTGAFSTPRPEEPESSRTEAASNEPIDAPSVRATSSEAEQMLEQLRDKARLAAKGDGEELHPNVRRGAPPEFEGDVNPKTGEVGGPKNDPLRWGVKGDWSYNGRVTDF